MIVLDQVSKRFQRRDKSWFDAVHPLSLTIEQGEIFGLMGYSGAGKSTLLRLINLLERPDQGSVAVDGQELTALNAGALRQARQNIGMIFQQFNLLANRNIADNVAYPLEIAGWSKADIQSRVAECLAIVGLTEHADKYPSQLSGGQKQRVGIARALVHHPEILLCDEATSALDPESTSVVLSLLKEINHKLGITIVLITHEMQVIREICDQVVVIDAGEIVESGEVWSVFSQPQQGITQELLNLEQLDLPFRLNAEPTQLDTHAILKIRSTSDAHHPPDLKQILEHFPQTVHLYQSQVDTIQNHLIGTLIIAVPIQGLEIQSLLQKLKAHVTHVEVLGYARPTH